MLQFDNVSFAFGKKVVLEGVDLTFESGKTYGFVGANGVGKTTLFRLISGLYGKQGGSITWNNAPIKTSDISFLPTDPFFYPYMNGKEYLHIVLEDQEAREKAIQMCLQLHLPLDALVESYSTGMKKKLAFVASYKQNRDISILDEPFNGVDLESNEVLSHLISQKKADKIVLVSSHILSMMHEFCDEILYIQKGFEISRYLPSEYAQLRDQIKIGISIES